MKQTLFIFLFFLGKFCFAQNIELKIIGSDLHENQIIDSTSYRKKHENIKSVLNEVNHISQLLLNRGYLDLKNLEDNKINDSTNVFKIALGARTKYTYIYIGRDKTFFGPDEINNDTLKIPYGQTENFLKQKLIDVEKQGFALSRLNLENIRRKNSIIYADLNIYIEKKRTVNSIITNYTKGNRKEIFPKGHLRQLHKKYLNKTFTQKTIKELHDDINNFEFVVQTKYPEILFTNDSTKIYTYIEKRKSNNFDGYIGFTNDENKKLSFTGYLDITLQNTINAGEQFSLYWKNDGNQQTTFDTTLEIPYIFKSSLGIKAELNILKQDSTFQNSKTGFGLGYYINYKSKLYLGYQSTESSDIQNTNNNSISDFKNSYLTCSFEYDRLDPNNYLIPEKSTFHFTTGVGSRNTNNSSQTAGSSKQFFNTLNFSYNFELNDKNFFYLNSHTSYLHSKSYIQNELFRFGGIKSIRGFTENSLQASFTSAILTEYRFFASKNLYLHTIADYSLYQDPTRRTNSEKIEKLVGLGFGTAIQTTNGILKFTLANGVTNIQQIQLYNTMLNICYNVKF